MVGISRFCICRHLLLLHLSVFVGNSRFSICRNLSASLAPASFGISCFCICRYLSKSLALASVGICRFLLLLYSVGICRHLALLHLSVSISCSCIFGISCSRFPWNRIPASPDSWKGNEKSSSSLGAMLSNQVSQGPLPSKLVVF